MAQPGTAPFHNRLVPLICFIVFFSVLNGTMFNVAVPDIAEEFALSPGAVSWVITVYIVAFALAAVTYGKLADLYPVRNLITIGLVLFNIGALLGFLAGSYPLLIGARLIQASGGGAIPAMGMLVATRYFPPESRGRVLGAIASTVAFGSGVGPIVGGFLAGSFDWRGAVLLTGFIGMFLLFLTQGEPWALPPALVALAAFSLHIRRSPNPFVPASLFANLQYRSGLLTTFLAVGTIFCMFFLVPFHLRQIHQLDTWQIGLVLFPGAVSAAILGNVGGRLADRIGSPAVVSTGLTLLISGFLLLAAFASQGAYLIASILIVPYIGFSFIHASLAKTASLALHHSHIGIGMGFYNLVFFTAGAFGAALSSHLLEIAAGMVSIDPYRLIFLGAAITDLLALGIFHRRFNAMRRSKP
jgi:MFS transporter, DHA2 family, metal-tetracycline-proton antiporter